RPGLPFRAPSSPAGAAPARPPRWVAEALRPAPAGRRSRPELPAPDPGGALRGLLTHAQRTALERDAPSRFRLPTGREVPIAYEPDRPPWVSARIQELFGLRATPRLAGGRVALVVHVLAPHRRPVQVTDDLASFWRTAYSEVRKQLRGRYPKHAWPEDPLAARPTGRLEVGKG